jgi:hypothetical protein
MAHHHHRDPRLDRLRHRIHANRKGRARHYKRRIAYLQLRIGTVVARRHGLNHIVILDGAPCTLGQKLVLLDCRRHGGWSGVLVSGDRRENPRTRRLLHRLGLHTQVELIAEGYPANPVTLSSHCGYSDGVSEPSIEREHRFPMDELWMLGLDVTLWDALLAAARRLSYNLAQPYPATDEEHHVNLRKDPKHRLIERGLV